MAGEYCWAIAQAAGQSCFSLSGSNVSEFGLKLNRCYIHI
jgi:hypothetical protein